MKNVKVFEIKIHLNNGHLRTVFAIAPVSASLDEFCESMGFSPTSITFANVSAPMSEADALRFVTSNYISMLSAPDSIHIKTTITTYVA